VAARGYHFAPGGGPVAPSRNLRLEVVTGVEAFVVADADVMTVLRTCRDPHY
jgi:hypothetical protein